MTTKHTPGPWRVSDNRYIGPDLTDIGSANAGMTLATVPGGATSGPFFVEDDEIVAANARLIAAAPDLLNALTLAMTWIDNWSPNFTYDSEWPEDAAAIRAAIAKATGGDL